MSPGSRPVGTRPAPRPRRYRRGGAGEVPGERPALAHGDHGGGSARRAGRRGWRPLGADADSDPAIAVPDCGFRTTPLPSCSSGVVPFLQRPDADPALPMQSESGHPALSQLRLAFFGRNVVVVFGATEYVAPIRLRLFHAGGSRFDGVAYRIAPNPDGGETWTPDAFDEADLRGAAERIPSLRIVGAGCPTALEVGDDDLLMLESAARPPRRFVGPWRRRDVALPLRPPAADEARRFSPPTTGSSGCGSATRTWAPSRSALGLDGSFEFSDTATPVARHHRQHGGRERKARLRFCGGVVHAASPHRRAMASRSSLAFFPASMCAA